MLNDKYEGSGKCKYSNNKILVFLFQTNEKKKAQDGETESNSPEKMERREEDRKFRIMVNYISYYF